MRSAYAQLRVTIRYKNVKSRDQARKFRYSRLLLLVVAIFSAETFAEKRIEFGRLDGIKLPDHDRSLKGDNYESRKFSKRFKVKGWRISENLYMGGVKIDGEYGPGIVIDKGGHVWGFNHERIEFQLRF